LIPRSHDLAPQIGRHVELAILLALSAISRNASAKSGPGGMPMLASAWSTLASLEAKAFIMTSMPQALASASWRC
jgi:hypothetical protein